MKELFEEIAEKYNGSLRVSEDSSHNNYNHLPRHVYGVNFFCKGWSFEVRKELRSMGTSMSHIPSAESFSDRSVFKITATTTNATLSGFEVVSLFLLYKWITRNNKGFKVKTKNKKLKQQLEHMPELKAVYKFTEIDGEFTPELYGVNKNGVYTLTMNYVTKQERVGLLRNVVDFITKIPEIKT